MTTYSTATPTVLTQKTTTTKTSCFSFPRDGIAVQSFVAQNFEKGALSSEENDDVLRKRLQNFFEDRLNKECPKIEILPGGTAGRKKRDDARVVLADPVSPQRVEELTQELRAVLFGEGLLDQSRSDRLALVPEEFVLIRATTSNISDEDSSGGGPGMAGGEVLAEQGNEVLSEQGNTQGDDVLAEQGNTQQEPAIAIVFDTDILSRMFKRDTRSEKLRALIFGDESRPATLASGFLRHQPDEGQVQEKCPRGGITTEQRTSTTSYRKLISHQTQAELFAWILQRNFSTQRIRRLEEMLAGFEVVYPDAHTGLIWGTLMVSGRAQGRPPGPQDAWIAATALQNGALVCTNNQKDYEWFPGLRFFEQETSERGAGNVGTWR